MRQIRPRHYLRLATAVLLALLVVPSAGVRGASHREAPLIALDPAADNTDVYAFVSYDQDNLNRAPADRRVTFIMNVIPGQHPGDGPNYFNFDDDVLYRIHIDNNTDGVAEDIVYEFRFTTETRPVGGPSGLTFPLPYVGNPHIPVPQLQGITKLDGPGSEGLTRRQTYTVKENGAQLFTGRTLPLVAVPSNVGPATMPNYEALAAQGIYTDAATGIRVFAGQRAETFYIDLGAVFDTANLRRFPPVLTQKEDTRNARNPFGVNRFSGFNVHTIAIEVPITRVANISAFPIIGMYASTSRMDATGTFKQISRMANPLVNELIIDTPSKDSWNTKEPEDEAQFQNFYKNPSLALALSLIFDIPVPPTPRTDLMSALLKYPGQTLDLTPPPAGPNCGSPCAELLRLDLRVAPTAPENQKRLGPLAHDKKGRSTPDPAGWPNGRRPNDDVTDIALRVVAGVLSGDPCCTGFPHNRLGDGVNFLDNAPGTDVTKNGIAKKFPFLPTPHDGRTRLQVESVEREQEKEREKELEEKEPKHEKKHERDD